MLPSKKHLASRAYFPRGLVQPGKRPEKGLATGYRFSADALLLGCFLDPAPGQLLLDLGTGSGAVALAMLCRHPDLCAVGVDIQPEYVAAASANAAKLGFSQNFTALCADILASNLSPDLSLSLPQGPGSFDLALANPPYRQRDQGRLPPDPARLLALFEQPETLAAFCRYAADALKTGGRFGIIFPAKRRDELLTKLSGAGLVPLRILRILPHSGSPARVILVEAVKGSVDSKLAHYQIEKQALILHAGPEQRFSAAALAFCPFLAR